MVKRTLDASNPPKWTEAEKARFDAMTEADIDYSDIPPIRDFSGFTRSAGKLQSTDAPPIPVELDSDVVEFFKKTGKSYPSRISSILRKYIEAQRKAS